MKNVLSREPPHSTDFEQALLACCILEGGHSSLPRCIEGKIRPESFYLTAHQLIYQALLDLYNEGVPCNEIMLLERLSARQQIEKIGGSETLFKIANRIDTPAHLAYYIQHVRELELVRRVIHVSELNIEGAYKGHEHLDTFLETVEKNIFDISQDRVTSSAKSIQEVVDNVVMLVQEAQENKGLLSGIASGFQDLDHYTRGFQKGDMIVIAARPSIGKTAIALNIVEAALFKNNSGAVPTLFFSLEMNADQLALRLLCSRARVSLRRAQDGFMSRDMAQQLSQAASDFRNAPLWIDESASMTMLEIRAKARRLKSQHNIGFILIDYLQLLSASDSRTSREQQISEISRGIKGMAKELDVPVIVLSQLNRESEKERRQPRLSDLRESGSIEQDADLVLILTRKKDSENEADDVDTGDFVARDLIIAKQRNGPVGVVHLGFHRNITRFECLDRES